MSEIRVLIVEDNPDTAAVIATSLTHLGEGFVVKAAATLTEALQAMAVDGIDVVVLDMSLPDSRGIGTLDRLRAVAGRLPIIVVSGVAQPDFDIETIRHGAVDFLAKTRFSAADLPRVVRYAYERANYKPPVMPAKSTISDSTLCFDRIEDSVNRMAQLAEKHIAGRP